MSPLVSPRWQIITTALLPAGFLTSLNLSGQLLMASWFTLNFKSAVSEGELGASGGAFKVLPSKNRGELFKKKQKTFQSGIWTMPRMKKLLWSEHKVVSRNGI